tara:strand:+ start:395 stop:943 length:549 start_codon:yes stop_codon:yes gene_type:complete
METYIALLRGINVGGKNMLPMKILLELLSDSSTHISHDSSRLENIKTYLQTGNIIYQSLSSPELIKGTLSVLIEDNFGFKPEIIILSVAEFDLAIKNNPYQNKVGNSCLFFFCKEAPTLDSELLNKLIATSENYQLKDKVFYLHAPDGVGKSKLVKKIEVCLGVKATARNLNTVNKIAQLSG